MNENIDRDVLRERIESRIASLEKHAEIMEDLVQGDPDRHMRGIVHDLAELRSSIDELMEERRILKEFSETRQRFEEFMEYWKNKEAVLKGIAIGLGLLGFTNIATFITQILGG